MPSIAWTYATLTTALQDWLEDSFTDFVAAEDTLIGLGEQRVLTDLRLGIFDSIVTSISTAIGVATITVPAGTLRIQSLYVAGAWVDRRSLDYVTLYGSVATAGRPIYYAENNATTVALAPTPTAVEATRFQVIKRPDPLSGSNATSWIGTNVPDLLFYACLAAAESFVQEDQRKAAWEEDYQKRLLATREELHTLVRDDTQRVGSQPNAIPRPMP